MSDIHANGDALDAVAREIARRRPDRVVHLGDLVGYNAEPERCVAWAADHGVDGILGNHDAVACGKADGANFNPVARAAALWTAAQLSDAATAFLARLPDRIALGDDILLVHGAPSDPDRYLFRLVDAEEEFAALGPGPAPRVVFCGHTHVPAAFVRRLGGAVVAAAPGALRLGPDARAILNPGSVGQPRDRDPRASFVVFDTDSGEAEWVRVSYDVTACQEKVLGAGLPRFLAARLAEGA